MLSAISRINISISLVTGPGPIRLRLETRAIGIVIILMVILLIDLMGSTMSLVRSSRAGGLATRHLRVDGRIVTRGRVLRLALLLGICRIAHWTPHS